MKKIKSGQKKDNGKGFLTASIVLLILSILMIILVANENSFVLSIDEKVNSYVENIQNPTMNVVMIAITSVGNLWVLMPLSSLLILALLFKKKYHKAIFAFTVLAAGVITGEVLKYGINRLRPFNSLIIENDPSFPSGHTLMSTVFFLIFIYEYRSEIKKSWKKVFVIFFTLVFIMIGLSRLCLNVHWMSDVLSSFLIGGFWVCFFVFLDKQVKHHE
jgi:undecaprenyl-diphosphatase